MAEFKFRTKGNAAPQGKPRVYFTCHPEDFDRYFEKICEDIFASHEPAIYYTADMSEALDDTNINVDLGRMNLFVVPVTFRLMNEPNRAMSVDIAYAKEHNIPILPFMMESGIDSVYALSKNFGERQYLSPYSSDTTGVSYEKKLENYLKSILISDEMANRVRAAFDAYIFLSYRKKDRRYADDLMRIIHNIPGCRDIAIWYDEFLTPGESFMKNIEKAMQKSELFALLVTPNLLEDGNFVMTKEYPAARDAGMDILPTEMVETDHDVLKKEYDGIPEPVKTEDEHFTEAMLASIKKIAISENDNNPEHNFLIGLAYLEGIDVEVDVERGIELITKAADGGLIEAMEKLYNMYNNGDKVQVNYTEALKWAECVTDFYTNKYGDEHHDTLIALNNLAVCYDNIGCYQKAVEIYKKVYETRLKTCGEDDIHILTVMSNLSVAYGNIGDYHSSFEISERAYKIRCRVLGEEHPDTLMSLNNLALSYGELGNHQKSLELYEKVYKLSCRVLGEDNPTTVIFMSNLGAAYIDIGDYHSAFEINERAYKTRCKVLGEEHPDTLLSLNNLAGTYGKLGEDKKSLELYEKAYKLSCRVLGEDNPTTICYMSNLATSYGHIDNYRIALKYSRIAYDKRCKILGEEHPDTILSLNNLAFSYSNLREYKRSFELEEKAIELSRRVLGNEHPTTLLILSNHAMSYSQIGKRKESLKLNQEIYDLKVRVLGKEHPDTLLSLSNIADIYSQLRKYKKAAEHYEKLVPLARRVLGNDHLMTAFYIRNLAMTYSWLGKNKMACKLLEEVYAIRLDKLGENHDSTKQSLLELLSHYTITFQFKKAGPLFKKYMNS